MKNYKLLLTGLALVAGFILFGATTNSFASGLMVWGKTPANIHEFTGLPLDINGWTDFRYMIKEQNLYHDARVVFVSSSVGSDSEGQFYGVEALTFDEHGLFQQVGTVNAYETLAEAAKQLRNGYPDIMLLKRGDVWIETLPAHNKSGRSAIERAIYASYGSDSARPVVRPIGNIMSSIQASNLIFTHLHFYAAHKDPSHPDYQSSSQSAANVRWVGNGQNILVEGVHSEYNSWIVQGWSMSGNPPNTFHNVAFRRCFIEKAYVLSSSLGHQQGLWTAHVYGLLLEESAWYHNGWRADLNNSTQYNHNVYLASENWDVTFQNNFSIKASGSGLQLRPGGTSFGNVFSHNPASHSFGYGNDAVPGGAFGVIAYNVMLSAVNYPHGDPLGRALWLGNIKEAHVLENIIANNHSATAADRSIGILNFWERAVNDLTLERNIVFNQGGIGLVIGAGETYLTGLRLIENEIDTTGYNLENYGAPFASITESADNKFNTTRVSTSWFRQVTTNMSLADWNAAINDTTSTTFTHNYPDPYRVLATYSASLGYDETLEAFADELRKQQRNNWREEFTARPVVNYIRAGFGRGTVPEGY